MTIGVPGCVAKAAGCTYDPDILVLLADGERYEIGRLGQLTRPPITALPAWLREKRVNIHKKLKLIDDATGQEPGSSRSLGNRGVAMNVTGDRASGRRRSSTAAAGSSKILRS